MRIVYLHQYYVCPDEPGGTRSYEFARRLVQRGHTVDLITSRWQGPVPRAPRWTTSAESGINVHRTAIPYSNEMPFPNRLRAFARFACRAAARAKRIPCDVVFATSTPLTIVWPAVRAARRQSVPFVFEVRDLWPDIPVALGLLRNPLLISLTNRLERYAYENAAKIIALSPDAGKAIAAKNVADDKVAVVPNAADLDIFSVPIEEGWRFRQERDWLGNRPLIVYAGTMGYVNGVEYLVRIARHCKDLDADVRFLVVGSGKDEGAVRLLATKLGVLQSNFFMIPPIPKRQLPGVLSAADVSLSLVIDNEALWANSANKFFDALASGTPVAINYQGWQAKILRDSGAGIVLPPNDAQKAADMLVKVVRDTDWLQRAGTVAKELATTRFSREMLYERFETVLWEAARLKGAERAV